MACCSVNSLDLTEVLVKEAILHLQAKEASHHLRAMEEALHFQVGEVTRHLQEEGVIHQEHHQAEAGGLLNLQLVPQ
jgi:hypothetical protein